MFRPAPRGLLSGPRKNSLVLPLVSPGIPSGRVDMVSDDALLGRVPALAQPSATALPRTADLCMPQPPLFDETPRSDPRPASDIEDSFTFLNRVAGPYWERVRQELNRWYAAFPDERGGLRSRFRKRPPQQHYAAWWELYLHRLFSCLGFEIGVERPLPHTSKRPDFLLSRADGSFFLEATTVFSGIVEEGRHGARESEVRHAINTIKNRSWHVGLNFNHVGRLTPSRVSLTEPIAKWLAKHDPDAVLAQLAAGGDAPRTTIPVDDWELDLVAMPVSKEHRDAQDHRLIGIGPVSAGPVNDREQIAKRVRAKRSRYGELDRAYVIALLSTSTFLEDRDVEQILFGSHALALGSGAGEGQLVRQPDGLWVERHAQPGQRMSALLVGMSIFQQNCAQTWPRLWVNPWAARPLEIRHPFPTARVVNDVVEFEDAAKPPYEVLGLPTDWPGPDPPFPRR